MANNKKEETAMYSETETQRYHLENRLSQVFYQKQADARKRFGLASDGPPRSFQDLLERIQSGRYIFDESKQDVYGGLFSSVEWRDPAVKKDKEGYNAWNKKLSAEYEKTMDEIKILSPEKGLEAFRAFEAYQVE